MITNIQALRAFAAINVVFVHSIDIALEYSFASSFAEVFKGWGANGVDIFFIISGFIMVFTQSKNRRSAYDFLIQRVKRIAPTYWFYCMLIVTLFVIFPSGFNRFSTDAYHALSSFFFMSRLIFERDPVVGVGWTLEYEMMFYLIFGISLIAKDSRVSYGVVGLSLIGLVFWGGARLIVLEFLLGMLIGIFYIYNNENYKSRMTSLSPYIFLIGIIGLFSSLLIHIEVNRFFKWGIPGSLIVFGLLYMRQIDSRILMLLGASSYSIYLSQSLITPAFYKAVKLFVPHANGTVLVLACAFTSILLGYLLYQLVEIRLGKLVKA